MNTDKVTIGLISYKEKEVLGQILSDLKNQNTFDKIEEVLLIQNSSCQKTNQIALDFSNKLPLKIMTNFSNNIGKARSLIVTHSTQDLIVFVDADCRVATNWLQLMLENWSLAYTKGGIALAAPNRLPENQWWKKIVNLSLSHPLGHGWSPQAWVPETMTATYHIPTTNALFLKEKLLEAGNFSSNYCQIGEDLELGLRLNKLGTLYLFPKPFVSNNSATSYWRYLKRLFFFASINVIKKTTQCPNVKPTKRFKFLNSINAFLFQNRNGNFLLLTSSLLVPILLISLIGSLFNYRYLFILYTYGCLLILSSAYIFYKNKHRLSLSLSFFWFIQQIVYSLGVCLGVLLQKKLLTRKTSVKL